MAAAVSDYRPVFRDTQKIKKQAGHQDIVLELTENPDILAELGRRKKQQVICGFAMETDNVLANAKRKLLEKKCDYLVLNDLNDSDAGFQKDTNKVTVLSKAESIAFPVLSKEETAQAILKTLIGENTDEFTGR